MADTLQQFLVELGFTTKGQQQFLETIRRGERAAIGFGATVGKIGAVITATGIAALKDTKAYAQAVEQLGFAATRAGTSLKNLQAIQLAGASFGSSSSGAQASVESLASFMRRNPGAPAFLKQFGVNTTDAQGKPLDTTTILEEMAQSFRKMPVWRAEQVADMTGISENMMLAMRNPGFDAKFRAYAAAEGRGVEKSYDSAHALMNQDRLMAAHLFGDKARAEVPAMDAMTAALKVANKELSDTNGWLAKIAGLWGTYGSGIEAGAATGGAIWAAKKILGRGAAASGADAAADAAGAGAAAGIGLRALGVGAGLMLYSPSLNSGEGSQLAMRRKGLVARQQYAVWRLMQMGLTEAQAIGMAANFTAESGLNSTITGDRGTAYGIAQWHPDRQAAFRRFFGHDIHKSTLDEQLAFSALELKNNPAYRKTYAEMVGAGANARLQAMIVSRGYERPGRPGDPGFGEQQARARGAIAQTINATINVHGSGDPKLTAHEVVSALKHQSQQLARYSSGGMQ